MGIGVLLNEMVDYCEWFCCEGFIERSNLFEKKVKVLRCGGGVCLCVVVDGLDGFFDEIFVRVMVEVFEFVEDEWFDMWWWMRKDEG